MENEEEYEEEYEEEKPLGQIECPSCHKVITVKKRTTYNQEHKRKKIAEELFAEFVQEVLGV